MDDLKQQIDTHYKLLIDGQFVDGKEGKTFKSVCPASGEELCTLAEAGEEDVDLAVKAAQKAFKTWKALPAPNRAMLLNQIAESLEKNIGKIAAVEALDCGKPVRDIYANNMPDGISTASFYRYFAAACATDEGDAVMLAPDLMSITVKEPIGVVGVIAPWNYPFELANWMIVAAIAAGCTVVVKASNETPLSLAECGKIFSEVLPPGVVNIVQGKGSRTGSYMLGHPGINKYSFTGSTEVGRLVGNAAADRIVPSTLELGGKSANIIFPDCNVEKALEGVQLGLLANAGQTCIAGTRIFLHEDIYDAFLSKLVERFEKVKIGVPWDMATEMASMATETQMNTVLDYIEAGKKEGARVITGGNRLTDGEFSKGFYIQPTLLECTNDMRVAQEEIFGPVGCVIKFKDEDEVLAMANDSQYGLAGGLWTKDINRAMRIACGIETGKFWINCYLVMGPHAPFGGYKKSGIGRQNHKIALEKHQLVKNIIISLSEDTLGFYS